MKYQHQRRKAARDEENKAERETGESGGEEGGEQSVCVDVRERMKRNPDCVRPVACAV